MQPTPSHHYTRSPSHRYRSSAPTTPAASPTPAPAMALLSAPLPLLVALAALAVAVLAPVPLLALPVACATLTPNSVAVVVTVCSTPPLLTTLVVVTTLDPVVVAAHPVQVVHGALEPQAPLVHPDHVLPGHALLPHQLVHGPDVQALLLAEAQGPHPLLPPTPPEPEPKGPWPDPAAQPVLLEPPKPAMAEGWAEVQLLQALATEEGTLDGRPDVHEVAKAAGQLVLYSEAREAYALVTEAGGPCCCAVARRGRHVRKAVGFILGCWDRYRVG